MLRVLLALSTLYVRSRSAVLADVIIRHQNATPGIIAHTVFYTVTAPDNKPLAFIAHQNQHAMVCMHSAIVVANPSASHTLVGLVYRLYRHERIRQMVALHFKQQASSPLANDLDEPLH